MMKKETILKVSLSVLISIFVLTGPVSAMEVVNTDFETGTLEGWSHQNTRNYPNNTPGELDSPGLAGSNYAILFDAAEKGIYEEVALAVKYSQPLSESHYFEARVKANILGRNIGINMRDVNKTQVLKVIVGGYNEGADQIQAVILDPNDPGHQLRCDTGLTYIANEEFVLKILYDYANGTYKVWKDGDEGNGTAWEAVGGAGRSMEYIDVDNEHGEGKCWLDDVVVATTTASSSLFADVPSGYWAEDAICTIYDAGITSGCSQNPLRYCPEDVVTRAQMAIFLGRGIHGSGFAPPSANGIFNDVPSGYWAADWIEQFYDDGITSGCGQDPLRYCPENPVTRAQMAIFLLRAKYGSSYRPSAANGIFADVKATDWAADWIEALYQEGITAGCGTNPLRYCPDNLVTRAQMAVFLMRTFDL